MATGWGSFNLIFRLIYKFSQKSAKEKSVKPPKTLDMFNLRIQTFNFLYNLQFFLIMAFFFLSLFLVVFRSTELTAKTSVTETIQPSLKEEDPS